MSTERERVQISPSPTKASEEERRETGGKKTECMSRKTNTALKSCNAQRKEIGDGRKKTQKETKGGRQMGGRDWEC